MEKDLCQTTIIITINTIPGGSVFYKKAITTKEVRPNDTAIDEIVLEA